MSHWNYRVIRKTINDSVSYQVHEVYYREDCSIEMWTESPVMPSGETLGELREDIHWFLKAFQKPVLEEQIQEGKTVLVEWDDDYEINPGHYFEFMDRAWVASDSTYQYLGCHPLIKKEESLRKIYERVGEALADLYQEAGRLEFEKGEDRRPE